ncbi:hypothetical protein L4C33_07545, partial [Vibrio makurazakiensis]|uniref:hypothetical protein n=1 Tax=Vibrio makurazakiensis TaxID=2910250 RepID=UPI003D101212
MQIQGAKFLAAISFSALVMAFGHSCTAKAAYLDEESGEVIITSEHSIDVDNIHASQEMLGNSMEDYIRTKGTEQKVNYGDPTASYKGIGVSRDRDSYKLSGIYGDDDGNIGSAEIGKNTKKSIVNYRVRYFKVSETGDGLSLDVVGSDSDNTKSTGILAGYLHKFDVSPNIIVAPMLSVGKVFTTDYIAGEKYKTDSIVAQPGIYAMYGFDAGHWLYANPKSTYVQSNQKWNTAIEVGAGYMLTDSSSVGIKYEYSSFLRKKEDNTSFNY